MGVHTGDSITVAPAQTLTDKEYQLMRDAAVAIIRAIGVETGGSNIQFAVNPQDGRLVVIEMNPRVCRSSALASKATGFPIAKIAAKLAVGYTLDELRNDITRETPACFEPVLDYCVVKIPRWAFEKFPEADPTLTTQMKSVGEVMAIGRTFKEALQKAIRSLEQDRWGLTLDRPRRRGRAAPAARACPTPTGSSPSATPTAPAVHHGEIHELTQIDPWFLENIREIVAFEADIAQRRPHRSRSCCAGPSSWASPTGASPSSAGQHRGATSARCGSRHGIRATFKTVDTCAAEFEAYTPYLYSTYEEEDEAPPTPRPKVVILGSGPNRIGQGIEFDYCCVHAAFALRELGVEAIMVNCNPETVSTDYDTSDRLYFEPLTLEDVLNIVEKERPLGVIVQFGGQTPLKLAVPLQAGGRAHPGHLARRHRPRRGPPALQRPAHRARSARRPPGPPRARWPRPRSSPASIGYPVLVRPSYVLGGRAMQIVHDARGPPDVHVARRYGSSPRASRSSSTSSWRTPSRSTSTPWPTASASWSAASWSTSRRPASTPATPPARCRPTRSATTRCGRCARRPRPWPGPSA